MSEIEVVKDVQARTLRVTTRYAASPERVWLLWADPRLLERWWGPPTYPATVVDHDLSPGGRVTYLMTGPEGDKHHGWWQVLDADPHRSLELEDGFADDSGTPNPDLPVTHMRMTLEPDGGGTRMTVVSTFPSTEAFEQLLAMGMDEGLREAMGQIPALLGE